MNVAAGSGGAESQGERSDQGEPGGPGNRADEVVDAAHEQPPQLPLAPELAFLGARPLSPSDPAMVGRYRIHALLGVGGMGRVYLGAAHGSGRAGWAAVKVIRPDLADNPEFRRRFARELEAVGRVSTPHAAALVQGEPRAAQPWMATEFVPGVALGDAVRQDSALPDPAVWRLAADLGSALVAVHQAGLVHRDVKPSNVILGTEGAKIIDFGVAHASDLSQLTATGLNLGTPSYMAPEQAKSGEVTPASDIFSLGVLLYFAATGKLPFGEGGTAEVLFRVVYEEPDFDSLAQISPALRDLVLRCLAKEPLGRPNAAGVLALTQAAATAGEWTAGRFAQWPTSLAARIAERTKAAGQTLPELLAQQAQGSQEHGSQAQGSQEQQAAQQQVHGAAPDPGLVAQPEFVASPNLVPQPVFDAQVPVIPVPPALAPDDDQTVLVDGRGGAASARSGGAPADSRKRRLVVGSAAAAVVALGVVTMLLWGTGGGDGADGGKVDSLSGTGVAVPGGDVSLGAASGTGSAYPSATASPTSTATGTATAGATTTGSVSPASSRSAAASSANAGSGTGSGSGSGTGSGSGGANGVSTSAAAGGGGGAAGGSGGGSGGGSTTSTSTSAAAAPTSAAATTAAATASPVNTGCSGWDTVELGSEYGYGSGAGSWNLYIGPYSACSTTGFVAAHGDRLRLWCYVTNSYGNEWTYVQDTVNDRYGWISDANFVGAVGATNRC